MNPDNDWIRLAKLIPWAELERRYAQSLRIWGVYPERMLADKAYRNQENHQYCKERGIRMSGPKLGRPPKDKALYRQQLLEERSESGERNAIESFFGVGKRRYGRT